MKLRGPKTPVFVKIAEDAVFKTLFGGKIEMRTTRGKFDDRPIKLERLEKLTNREYLWEHVKENETLLTNGYWVEIDKVIPIDVPKISKDEKALLVKNSEWAVSKNMTAIIGDMDDIFPDYDCARDIRMAELSKGTKVIMHSERIKKLIFDELSCLVNIDDNTYWMPIRFFGGMDCTKQGKEKTYWKILDGENSPVRTKRYKNLNSLKSAVVIITGQAKADDEGLWWLDGAVSSVGFTNGESKAEILKNWSAVEYSYLTDNEIQRVDLDQWYCYHLLKHS